MEVRNQRRQMDVGDVKGARDRGNHARFLLPDRPTSSRDGHRGADQQLLFLTVQRRFKREQCCVEPVRRSFHVYECRVEVATVEHRSGDALVDLLHRGALAGIDLSNRQPDRGHDPQYAVLEASTLAGMGIAVYLEDRTIVGAVAPEAFDVVDWLGHGNEVDPVDARIPLGANELVRRRTFADGAVEGAMVQGSTHDATAHDVWWSSLRTFTGARPR